jgi:hypothetical protein
MPNGAKKKAYHHPPPQQMLTRSYLRQDPTYLPYISTQTQRICIFRREEARAGGDRMLLDRAKPSLLVAFLEAIQTALLEPAADTLCPSQPLSIRQMLDTTFFGITTQPTSSTNGQGHPLPGYTLQQLSRLVRRSQNLPLAAFTIRPQLGGRTLLVSCG